MTTTGGDRESGNAQPEPEGNRPNPGNVAGSAVATVSQPARNGMALQSRSTGFDQVDPIRRSFIVPFSGLPGCGYICVNPCDARIAILGNARSTLESSAGKLPAHRMVTAGGSSTCFAIAEVFKVFAAMMDAATSRASKAVNPGMAHRNVIIPGT